MKRKILLYSLLFLMAIPVLAQHTQRRQGYYVGRKGRHIETQRVNRRELLRQDSLNAQTKVGGMRFAQKFQVDITPDNAGELFVNEDGSSVWKLSIQSEEAYSINLQFSEFHLAERDTIFIYNKEQSAVMCLTEKNNLKSNILPIAPINGDELTVEYRQSNSASSERKLRISDINHAYIDLRGLPTPNALSEDTCSPHATCDESVSTIKQSVCLLVIDGTGLCSGTLVNNTKQDGRPFVLTGAHCFGIEENDAVKINRAASVVAFLNYEVPNCTPSIRGSMEFTIGGATMRALASDMDMALIELSSIPPADFRPYYAGWNLSAVPVPPGPYRGIHHPTGAVKRVATTNKIQTASASFTDIKLISNCLWQTGGWENSTTAPGSSGSGLFDASGKLLGSLIGGNSFCGNKAYDYYSRMEKSWNYYPQASKQLKVWLDPLNSGVKSLEGLDPYHSESAKRLSNIKKEPVEKAYLPAGGLLAGQNAEQAKEYAEYYSFEQSAYIYGVYAVCAIAGTSQNKIDINVYGKGENNMPGALLASKSVALSSLQWNSNNNFYYTNKTPLSKSENYIRFDTPVETDKDFFVAYTVPYTGLPADSFAVYTAVSRDEPLPQTSFVRQSDDNWISMIDFSEKQTALWLDPVLRVVADTATNNGKQDEDNTPKLYPNPASNYLTIDLKEKPSQRGMSVALFDCVGKQVLQQQLYQQKGNTLDLHNLQSGIYFLQVNGNKKETYKVIVK